MEKAVSCGGVVIFRGKVLLLYKNFHNRYEGWVLPKGTVEKEETYQETALREVRERQEFVPELTNMWEKVNILFIFRVMW